MVTLMCTMKVFFFFILRTLQILSSRTLGILESCSIALSILVWDAVLNVNYLAQWDISIREGKNAHHLQVVVLLKHKHHNLNVDDKTRGTFIIRVK